ncbi:hypothetical protein BJ944DRAFT_156254 [Cunninghamella echinulata]|nr:hypothetical protein BJ944DRAFT_156254 [Cunninghamella echinulata]
MASSTSTQPQSQTQSHLTLRSYKPSDFEQVHFIFYSTYFALVPEGVKQKIKTPLFWIGWLLVYFYLLSIVPVVLSGMPVPSWAAFALQIFFTFAWIAVSFAGVFVLTDRFDAVEYIEQARQNDLQDPEITYMNYIKEEHIVSDDKETKSHFWVLQMDNQLCGMIGLAQYQEIQYDQRPPLPPGWKKIGQLLCERYNFSIPSFLQFDTAQNENSIILAQPHAPHTASLQRLAVKQEYHGCGLSTLLINRALTWAYEQGITQVFAVTNEMQSTAAKILQQQHQFTMVKKEKKNWFGNYEITWVCHVQQWYDTHTDALNMFKNTTNTTD